MCLCCATIQRKVQLKKYFCRAQKVRSFRAYSLVIRKIVQRRTKKLNHYSKLNDERVIAE